ncbi:MAG TPA: hypothetical protein VF618_23325 [Thermoanaerobaculia bacterium]
MAENPESESLFREVLEIIGGLSLPLLVPSIMFLTDSTTTQRTVTQRTTTQIQWPPDGTRNESVIYQLRALTAQALQGLHLPVEMTQGEPVIVRLVVSKAGQITNSPVVKIDLVGDGFTIISQTPAEQYVGAGNTQWSWLITPESAGNRSLTVNVIAIVNVPGYSEKPQVLRTYTHRTLVVRNMRYIVNRFTRAHWQWLAGSLLLPGVLWVFPRLRRRHRQRAGFV